MLFVPLEFYDAKSSRRMKLDYWPGKGEESKPWVFYKHPDGQWVSLREATPDDIERLENAREEESKLWNQHGY